MSKRATSGAPIDAHTLRKICVELCLGVPGGPRPDHPQLKHDVEAAVFLRAEVAHVSRARRVVP